MKSSPDDKISRRHDVYRALGRARIYDASDPSESGYSRIMNRLQMTNTLADYTTVPTQDLSGIKSISHGDPTGLGPDTLAKYHGNGRIQVGPSASWPKNPHESANLGYLTAHEIGHHVEGEASGLSEGQKEARANTYGLYHTQDARPSQVSYERQAYHMRPDQNLSSSDLLDYRAERTAKTFPGSPPVPVNQSRALSEQFTPVTGRRSRDYHERSGHPARIMASEDA